MVNRLRAVAIYTRQKNLRTFYKNGVQIPKLKSTLETNLQYVHMYENWWNFFFKILQVSQVTHKIFLCRVQINFGSMRKLFRTTLKYSAVHRALKCNSKKLYEVFFLVKKFTYQLLYSILEVSALWIFQEKLQMRSFLAYK